MNILNYVSAMFPHRYVQEPKKQRLDHGPRDRAARRLQDLGYEAEGAASKKADPGKAEPEKLEPKKSEPKKAELKKPALRRDDAMFAPRRRDPPFDDPCRLERMWYGAHGEERAPPNLTDLMKHYRYHQELFKKWDADIKMASEWQDWRDGAAMFTECKLLAYECEARSHKKKMIAIGAQIIELAGPELGSVAEFLVEIAADNVELEGFQEKAARNREAPKNEEKGKKPRGTYSMFVRAPQA